MDLIKKEFLYLFFLLFIQSIIFSPLCLGMDNEREFIEYPSKGVSRLRNELQIPIGSTFTVLLKEGTPSTDIPELVSQERRTHGLTGQIPENQREQFSRLPWRINNTHIERAPMPGTITNLMINVGQQVNRGDPLCLVEAMKMENTMRAPTEGKISHIYCKVGDLVDAGTILISSTKWGSLAPELIELLLPFFPWATTSFSGSPNGSPTGTPDARRKNLFREKVEDHRRGCKVAEESSIRLPSLRIKNRLFHLIPSPVLFFPKKITGRKHVLSSLPHPLIPRALSSHLRPHTHAFQQPTLIIPREIIVGEKTFPSLTDFKMSNHRAWHSSLNKRKIIMKMSHQDLSNQSEFSFWTRIKWLWALMVILMFSLIYRKQNRFNPQIFHHFHGETFFLLQKKYMKVETSMNQKPSNISRADDLKAA